MPTSPMVTSDTPNTGCSRCPVTPTPRELGLDECLSGPHAEEHSFFQLGEAVEFILPCSTERVHGLIVSHNFMEAFCDKIR